MASQRGESQGMEAKNGKGTSPLPGTGRFFEIRVRGHLSSQWSDWLEGLEVQLFDSGDTILSGPIIDQAALMGILNKLSRLNLTLLALREVDHIELEEHKHTNHG